MRGEQQEAKGDVIWGLEEPHALESVRLLANLVIKQDFSSKPNHVLFSISLFSTSGFNVGLAEGGA